MTQVGGDRSAKLCSICQSRGHESLICDCLSLPLRTAAFDAVLCIAVVHHLSTEVKQFSYLYSCQAKAMFLYVGWFTHPASLIRFTILAPYESVLDC